MFPRIFPGVNRINSHLDIDVGAKSMLFMISRFGAFNRMQDEADRDAPTTELEAGDSDLKLARSLLVCSVPRLAPRLCHAQKTAD